MAVLRYVTVCFSPLVLLRTTTVVGVNVRGVAVNKAIGIFV